MTTSPTLDHVLAVKAGKSQPHLVATRALRLPLGKSELTRCSTDELWTLHEEWRTTRPQAGCRTGVSPLDLKIELARRLMGECALCERRCGVDRLAGQEGFCRTGLQPRCFQQAALVGEEPFLVPSHEVFLTGCNLRCRYCYAWEHVAEPARGRPVTPTALQDWAADARSRGCDHLNLLGGEPTVNLAGSLQCLRNLPDGMFVVWNSNMTASVATMKLLEGVVDLYLGDCRAGNPACAEALTGWWNVFDVAVRNFHLASQHASLVVRHLLVPGHVDCCFAPLAARLAKELPQAAVHLLFQYLPHSVALHTPGLNRPLSDGERERALELARDHGLHLVKPLDHLTHERLDATDAGPAFETEVAILPDGRVSFQQLSAGLASVAWTLAGEGLGAEGGELR